MAKRDDPTVRFQTADAINENDYFQWLKTYLEERPATEPTTKVIWYACCPKNRRAAVDADLQEMQENHGSRVEVVKEYFDNGDACSDDFDTRIDFRKARLHSIKENLPILVPSVERFVRSRWYRVESPSEELTTQDIMIIADGIKGLTLLTVMRPSSRGAAKKVKTTLSQRDIETRRWVELRKAGLGWAEIVDAEKISGNRESARERIRHRVNDHFDDFNY